MIITMALLLSAATGMHVLVMTPTADDYRDDVPRVLLEAMVSGLKEDARLKVLSSTDVKDLVSVATEQQLRGCDSTACMTEIAAAFGAGLVVFGDVNRVGREVQLSLRLINVNTGEILGRESQRAPDTAALTKAAPALAARLINKAFPTDPITFITERPLALTGAIVGGVGVLGTLGFGGWAGAMAFTLFGDPTSSATAKTDANNALGPVAIAALTSLAVGTTGAIMLTIGLAE